MHAAWNGKAGAVEHLLKQGRRKGYWKGKSKFHTTDFPLDLNQQDGRGRTALIGAVYRGEIKAVRLLLEQGEDFEVPLDLNKREYRGQTALTIAVKSGQHMVVRLLLEKGKGFKVPLDLNKPDYQGQTALTHAVYRAGEATSRWSFGSTEKERASKVVRLLVEKGKDFKVPLDLSLMPQQPGLGGRFRGRSHLPSHLEITLINAAQRGDTEVMKALLPKLYRISKLYRQRLLRQAGN